MSQKERIKIWVIIFAIALIIRLALFFYLYSVNGPDAFNPFLQGTDQAEYGRVAINLLENKVFSLSQTEPFAPDPSRTPVFPLFLALGYALGGCFILPTLLNILISALTVIIVFEIAALISKNKKISIASAIIFSLLPYGIYLSNLIMADTLFVFLFSLFLLFFLRILSNRENFNFRNIVLASIFLGLATLVRPITQFFILIPAVLLFFLPSINFKKKIYATFISLIIFAAVLSPWLIRNYIHFDRIFLSSIGQHHLYASYFTPWQAYREGISRHEAHSRMLEYVRRKYGQDAMYNISDSSALAQEAKKEILKSPFNYGFFHLASMPIYFLNNDVLLTLREAFRVELPNIYIAEKIFKGDFAGLINAVFGANFIFVLFFFASYLFVALKSVFGILGAIFHLWRDRSIAVFSLATFFYFPLIIGFEGHARFRLPVEPLLVIFSIAAILKIFDFIRQKRVLKFKNG